MWRCTLTYEGAVEQETTAETPEEAVVALVKQTKDTTNTPPEECEFFEEAWADLEQAAKDLLEKIKAERECPVCQGCAHRHALVGGDFSAGLFDLEVTRF